MRVRCSYAGSPQRTRFFAKGLPRGARSDFVVGPKSSKSAPPGVAPAGGAVFKGGMFSAFYTRVSP